MRTDQSETRERTSLYLSQVAPSGSGNSLSLFTEDCISLSGAETLRMRHWGRADKYRADWLGAGQGGAEQSCPATEGPGSKAICPQEHLTAMLYHY